MMEDFYRLDLLLQLLSLCLKLLEDRVRIGRPFGNSCDLFPYIVDCKYPFRTTSNVKGDTRGWHIILLKEKFDVRHAELFKIPREHSLDLIVVDDWLRPHTNGNTNTIGIFLRPLATGNQHTRLFPAGNVVFLG